MKRCYVIELAERATGKSIEVLGSEFDEERALAEACRLRASHPHDRHEHYIRVLYVPTQE
jgi:hypothetical protein